MGTGGGGRLETSLCGAALCSPIIAAAGTAGTLDELADILDLSRLGGIVTKSITRDKREGNPFPRITWTRGGMLNAIGLMNPGLDAFERDIAPRIAGVPTTVIGSIAGDSIDDYLAIARVMDATPGLGLIELNVSCPNVHSGLEFGADPGALRELVGAVAGEIRSARLLVKLSPIAIGTPHSLVDLARVAIGSGAGGLTLCNTVPAMGIDVVTRRPVLANVTGGLSGPAIHNIIVRLVHLVHIHCAREAGVPIVAAGGVSRWQDAAEFILAGASAVQIGAGNFVDPRSPLRITGGLDAWVRRQGATNISELVGGVIL